MQPNKNKETRHGRTCKIGRHFLGQAPSPHTVGKRESTGK
jgi:hypothetical protein